MDLAALLYGILLPAVVAGVAILAARPWRRPEGAAGLLGASAGGFGPALGVGLGFAAGHAGLNGVPALVPSDTTHWLPHFALAAAALGALEVLVKPPLAVRIPVRLAAAAGALYLLLKPTIQYTWTDTGTIVGWLAGLSILTVVLWTAVEVAAIGLPGRAFAAAALGIASAVAVGLAATGSLKLGQAGGALASTFGAALVLSFFRPAIDLRGAAAPLAIVLAGLIASGHFFSETPSWLALGLAALPIGLGVAVALKRGVVVLLKY